jgi:D-methionine transport system substrate-binding protein
MSTEQTPDLIEAPTRKRWPLVVAGIAALAVIGGGAFAAISASANDDASSAGKHEVVKIGVVGASDPYWKSYEKAAEKEGIDVKLVDFTDYAQPNPALSAGELDLNQFQHIVYLADYNVANKDDLAPIGATATYPLGLYSKKYDDVDAIPDGATVAVPNDASNQARGLIVLQSAGLITLKSGGTIFSDLSDVDTEKSRVKVKALDAGLTATSLDDLAAAIVNNDFVEKAGLSFKDAIAKDDPADPAALPYVNIFAARADDADNPTYLKLVKIFQQTKAVTDGLVDVSGGTAVLATTPVTDLEKSLKDVEKDTAEHEKK